MRLLWPVAVTVAWIAGLVALTTWSATTPALWVAAAITVVAGLLVGRWRVLLVPLVLAVVSFAATLIDGCDPDEGCEASPLTYAILAFGAVLALAVPLAAGVAARQLVSGRREPVGSRS